MEQLETTIVILQTESDEKEQLEMDNAILQTKLEAL